MNIAILAANGKLGRLLVQEGLAKGLRVTAVARKSNQTSSQYFLKKDILELRKEDLAPFDVIISAFGVSQLSDLHLFSATTQHLLDLLQESYKRLIIAGGAGSLYIDEGLRWVDATDFPAELKPLAQAEDDSFALLRRNQTVRWLYVSPPADLRFGQPKVGKTVLSDDHLRYNVSGKSTLTYTDYAEALITEALSSKPHVREHISFLES